MVFLMGFFLELKLVYIVDLQIGVGLQMEVQSMVGLNITGISRECTME